MKLEFEKYHGAGNDFVMIDDRDLNFPAGNEVLIRRICDRRFGVGADGLILLQKHPSFDFKMVYFNADGKAGSMCGNGGRCVAAFAKSLGIIDHVTYFMASDGAHEAIFTPSQISLKMQDVTEVEKIGTNYYLNTGSPHYVCLVEDVEKFDVLKEGRKIRYNKRFAKLGTNVNFVEITKTGLKVRTYERGVEDETLSCGTGVTAAALVACIKGIKRNAKQFVVLTKGGKLKVSFTSLANNSFSNIWLHGPAAFVYKGFYYF
ncbi:MAG TPA: diaminopimelate epimerase [Bacteroidia bacterium]|nr:diaminopimelate epimerase [Bacteroidia bacterium]